MTSFKQNADAVVIGGGVIGCAVALELARNGLDVVVVDKGPGAGAGSTSASSAIIRFHYSTLDTVILAWESFHIWNHWEEHLGIVDDAGMIRYHRTGMLALDKPGSAAARENTLQLFDKVGVPYEVLSAGELKRRFPALDVGRFYPPSRVDDERFWSDPSGQLDAYFMPDAGFVDDPQLAAHNLMAAAEAQGARFSFRTRVTAVLRSPKGRVEGVELEGGVTSAAPVVVNCAGPFSSVVNRMAGVVDEFNVTTRALRQEVHVTPAPAGFRLDQGGTIVSDPDLGTYFRPQPGGTIVVGGVEPECDEPVWIDDPDDYNPNATVEVWEAQVYRLARRVPELEVPHRPLGVGALYDVTPDWVPIYDKTSLHGFYVAIGSSGNQFKNAPMAGRMMSELVLACEGGRDHDVDPLHVRCEHTGLDLNVGHFSRLRAVAETTNSVLG